MLSSFIQNELKVGKRIDRIQSDDDKSDLMGDPNDYIFDKIGNYLDEASGIKQKEADLVLATIGSDKRLSVTATTTSSSWNRRKIIHANHNNNNRGKDNSNLKLLSAKLVQRSQLKFKDKIDNTNHAFVPIIKDKPNSLKPLAILLEKTESDFDTYSHPYEFEIDMFRPNDRFLDIEVPQFPKPITETEFKFIRKSDDLMEMCNQLKTCDIIAVDLEHHSYRTFQGFTCLIQISTKTNDFIVDALELRSEIHVLNEVFTCPSILKVFHGADMDVQWLQRDFGVYVVNLFDTYQASKLLDFPHLSLSYLLKKYCNIDANKQFQLADWRIRPLTPDMLRISTVICIIHIMPNTNSFIWLTDRLVFFVVVVEIKVPHVFHIIN
ncbi:exosome component 10-like [Oppia nitens]|uniref:exosome component 10-like n=1 Tax=Oppia nitens TaxID=1686743 RepID=UPI0023D99ACE|nr:exosome component 10-like [Oppia nitens]